MSLRGLFCDIEMRFFTRPRRLPVELLLQVMKWQVWPALHSAVRGVSPRVLHSNGRVGQAAAFGSAS